VEYHNWLPQIGLIYSLGVDGLSLPLVILNTFLTGIAVYSIGDKVVLKAYPMP
jgi:NAD(P)H-quinone oxidoreductase subunit 4